MEFFNDKWFFYLGEIILFPTKKHAKNLNLISAKEWSVYAKSGKKPDDIPSGPQNYYKEWVDWYDFLGTKKK